MGENLLGCRLGTDGDPRSYFCLVSWKVTEKMKCGRIFEATFFLSGSLFIQQVFTFLLGLKTLVIDHAMYFKKTRFFMVYTVMERTLIQDQLLILKESADWFSGTSPKKMLTFMKQFSLVNPGWTLKLFMDCIANFCSTRNIFILVGLWQLV